MSIKKTPGNSNPTQLAEQDSALSAYLNDMLLEPSSTSNQAIDAPIAIEQVIAQSQSSEVEKDWRTSSFQALLFDVQGLKLAIPLHELNGILTWPEIALPKIPDKPSWYIGLYSRPPQHTQVVDTGHIVLPSSHQNKADKPRFIITIDGGKWGLACNQVESVVTLSPDEVRWRKQAGKRPWLAGTVLEQMCSILNINELVKLL